MVPTVSQVWSVQPPSGSRSSHSMVGFSQDPLCKGERYEQGPQPLPVFTDSENTSPGPKHCSCWSVQARESPKPWDDMEDIHSDLIWKVVVLTATTTASLRQRSNSQRGRGDDGREHLDQTTKGPQRDSQNKPLGREGLFHACSVAILSGHKRQQWALGFWGKSSFGGGDSVLFPCCSSPHSWISFKYRHPVGLGKGGYLCSEVTMGRSGQYAAQTRSLHWAVLCKETDDWLDLGAVPTRKHGKGWV